MRDYDAYKIAIEALIDDGDLCATDKVEPLKVLFRALHFAEKREVENKPETENA